MELDKIRSLSDEELKGEEAKAGEQLFRIRFAKSLGKQEGIGKIKSLKLDIARIKTIAKQRTLATAKEGIIMAETTVTTPATETAAPRRTEKVGLVVSTKMEKTIVVEIEMRKAHPKYKRVLKSNKKFYAHDEQNSARLGDMVRIRETRPLSKLKRWSLEEIIRRSSLSALPDEKPVVAAR
jgi:small subunit ribosomal protein S17